MMLIEDMGFSTRIKNALKINGVNTIDDLILLSEHRIEEFPNIGKFSTSEIIHKVKSLGFNFAPPQKFSFHYASDMAMLVNKIDELIILIKNQNKDAK